MEELDRMWQLSGVRQFQVVRCVVTGHRGRFGVEVSLVDPESSVAAFIDFVMLSDGEGHPTPAEFPPVGDLLDAVTLDFMPDGELRLSARPSSVVRQRERDAET
ncbi:hypothetical protein ACFY8V_02560 [Streptomyces californicus]|uniref:hypothetical protein n=1 Tax=Streptomyces TaxID=1883 RepID=UPI000BF05E32|nr:MULTISPECIES: hypothetical protein [unclassified Streptomyces]MDQ0986539.1 hypothetical protein [Streptomyces sp. V2I9]